MTHHRRGLRRLLNDDELLARIEQDWRTAGLDPKRTEMLSYATKLTTHAGEIEQNDVDRLQAAGFSDRDVHDIVEVTAYYAYVNRIADGLGVTVETWFGDD